MAVMTRTKELLLGLFRNYLPLSGGTMTGSLTFPNGKTIGDYLPLSGGTMTGEIEFSPNQKLPSGLVIGQIVESVLPLTDAGLHLLDGAKLPATGIYADFYAHCQSIQSSHPNLFVSESVWQTDVSTHGSCGKFVIDSDGIRLPRISNIVQGTSDLSQLGVLVEAGLPNITGTLANKTNNSASAAYYPDRTGALRTGVSGTHYRVGGPSGTSTDTSFSIGFDASLSNAIYGKSSTVQPQTIKVLLYICVANNTKSNVVVDIDRVATDLNGKLDRDLSNVIGSPVERVNSSGSNYVRYVNGTQICWGVTSGGDQWGDTNITFPAAFVDSNYGFTSTAIDSNGGSVATANRIVQTTSSTIKVKQVWLSTSENNYHTGFFRWVAIGRWK